MPEEMKTATDQAAENARTATDHAAGMADAATDRMREGTDQARATFSEHVVEPARRAGEAMKETGQKMVEGGSTIGVKMIDQAEANAREAFAAMRDAAQAKDFSAVMKVQADYLRDQGQRSMNQAREIGELIAQFGRDAVAPLRGQ